AAPAPWPPSGRPARAPSPRPRSSRARTAPPPRPRRSGPLRAGSPPAGRRPPGCRASSRGRRRTPPTPPRPRAARGRARCREWPDSGARVSPVRMIGPIQAAGWRSVSATDRDLEGALVALGGVVVDAQEQPAAGAHAEGPALVADEEDVVGGRPDPPDQRARGAVGHGAPGSADRAVEIALHAERAVVAERHRARARERQDVPAGHVDARVGPPLGRSDGDEPAGAA